jgi:hypothetical protein
MWNKVLDIMKVCNVHKFSTLWKIKFPFVIGLWQKYIFYSVQIFKFWNLPPILFLKQMGDFFT